MNKNMSPQMPLPAAIQHLELLREKIEALRDRTVTTHITRPTPSLTPPLASLPDDPTFYDRLWREHLKAAYERDQARRTP